MAQRFEAIKARLNTGPKVVLKLDLKDQRLVNL